ncbi:hypothetical protein HDU82_007851 [Entophlyctis luteolus]|nr:hypothetical protein HDU82_007851 [Entophlyctis luteolus]
MAASKTPRVRNAIHDDAIWRQTVHYELSTAQNWERYWGFMKDAMIANELSIRAARQNKAKLPPIGNAVAARLAAASQKHQQQQHEHDPRTSGLPSRLPPGLVLPQDDAVVRDLLVAYRVPTVVRARMPVDKYRVPCTTSAEVGWAWGGAAEDAPPVDAATAVGGCRKAVFRTLEKYGNVAPGRQDILKWWGGARESLP